MRSLIIVIAGSLIATLSLPLTAAAATITSKVTGGDWDLATTWDLNRVPGANDDVVIRDGSTVFATGLKFVKSLTVVHPGGTLTIGFAGGYSIATKGDIFISGRVIQPDALSADGAITVTATGSVQSNPNEGFVMFALGNIVIEKGGGVTPFGSRIPAETAGTPTRIQSRAGDITVRGNVIGIPGGKGNLGQGGQPPTPGGKGGEVSIIASKGHKIVVKEGPTIMGGAGGAAVEGGVAGALGKVKLLGGKEEISRDDIVGSSVEILGNGGIPNEVVGVLITSQGPGAVRATETDLTLATCPLMAIDLRGNTVAGIVSAARTAILEAETVFVDANQPNPVAAPHESDSNPRFTRLADLDGNGIADFCEEEIVNSLVTFSPTPSSFRYQPGNRRVAARSRWDVQLHRTAGQQDDQSDADGASGRGDDADQQKSPAERRRRSGRRRGSPHRPSRFDAGPRTVRRRAVRDRIHAEAALHVPCRRRR